MTVVTITKSKLTTLEKRASLYEKVLKSFRERRWDTETYSEKRILEFLKEDALDKKMQARLKKLLSSH